ncbi:pleckstrin homology domain-containing family M member 3 [Pristis pectinata]|uniref:pleckstrin homology domain-containing family M member 3 n=1 Tax=Pristis pectinata TaxID=685728 RepID=UPI00223C9CF2|nr:pleckstrin homology domain-containing family M member 3 [Pristis pectinata]XP_051884763.1 pleckstrin homology domain-containing family M member 3 [Pristis pectinata]XP_051884764.1 pleckstrin homology domain-containing family M member 3 [Pristis pectinata]XP_051884765.1 pleckstrin homology domain-containing family M member 3 [Pristis pectinata]XP_051884771.1 pleckstrin homology domain-containing family M member 3 [Pristis pectinata]XP_051884780.1 pleckstrin homology domain-containing family 
MEALEADDISPALEATEEFFLFSGIDDQIGHVDLPKQEVYGIQEVPVVIGHEILKMRNEKLQQKDGTRIAAQKMSISETTTQIEMRSKVLASKPVSIASGPKQQWADGSDNENSFTSNGYNPIHVRRNNPVEDGSTKRPLLFRSQSDIVPSRNRLQTSTTSVHCLLDFNLPPPSTATSFDKDKDFVMTTRSKDDLRPPSRQVLKKGSLVTRQDRAGSWKECYVELCPRELCLYSAEAGDDCHLCSVYYLSCCQSITVSASSGDRVLEILFSNGAWLQLQARSSWEAEDWRQKLLERMHALRQPQTLGLPNGTREAPLPGWRPGTCQVEPIQPKTLPLPTEGTIRIGLLHKLMSQDHWDSYTFVLSQSELKYFKTNDLVEEPLMSYKINRCLAVQLEVAVGSASRLKVAFPEEVLTLMADTQQELREWTEAIKAVTDPTLVSDCSDNFSSQDLRAKETNSEGIQTRRNKRYSVTSSFLSLLTVIAVEKGLTAQSFRCAGCQRPVGLTYGIAKVCAYSGWYYCQACHVDDLFLIPARLVHNWDTAKHKISKQAKEFLEYITEEPLIDIQQDNPCLYEHVDALATVLRLRQQLKSLRAYLFSCRASVAEDLRRRIFPREYILQHVHLYSLADLQQVFEGKLAPFLMKINKFASAHVYSCSLCSQKGFICEICNSGQIIYPFEGTTTKRCEICGAVFHIECKSRNVPCPRCVHRELRKKPRSFWSKLDFDDNFELCSAFEFSYPTT